MYSRKAWGGAVDPFILTKFLAYDSNGATDDPADPVVAFVIFEWKDERLLGASPSGDGNQVSDYVLIHSFGIS